MVHSSTTMKRKKGLPVRAALGWSRRVSRLLKAQENEDLALSGGQRLEGLTDDRAGAVHLHAGDVNRPRLHRRARLIAGHEEIAGDDRATSCVDADFDTARGGNHRFVVRLLTED